MHLVADIEIRRPAETVFAFLSTHANHARFIKENLSSEQVTPGPMAVGTRVKNVARAAGKDMVEVFEVTHFEPPRVLAKASQPGSTFDTTDRFELFPTAEGTRVQLTVTGAPRHVGHRVMFLVLTPLMARSMKRSLGTLKGLLEAA